MSAIRALVGNYCLTAAVLSWLLSQILKSIFNYCQSREFSAERLIGSGGMPSAHSAAVCALTLSVSRKLGVSSPEFAIAFMLAAVVMYDAMGIRRAAGEQAKVLNKLIELQIKGKKIESREELIDKDLKEFLGHTPLEVLAGAMLGIIIAMILPVR